MTRDVAQNNIRRYALEAPETLAGYQPSDWEVVDYKLYRFQKSPVYFRGPDYESVLRDTRKARTVAFLGAAQTLGRFCLQSLPDLVAAHSDWKAINFGAGGASPALFLALGKPFFDVVNRCDAVVLQVLSARAAQNAWMHAPNGFRPNTIEIKGSGEEGMFVNEAWKRLLDTLTARQFAQAIQQTQDNYVAQMRLLLERITVRKALMWYSERGHDYRPNYLHWKNALGPFPQFVDAEVMTKIMPLADDYIELISTAGRPHRLKNRFDGTDVAIYPDRPDPAENYYYPTPEMHSEAAAKVQKYLGLRDD